MHKTKEQPRRRSPPKNDSVLVAQLLNANRRRSGSRGQDVRQKKKRRRKSRSKYLKNLIPMGMTRTSLMPMGARMLGRVSSPTNKLEATRRNRKLISKHTSSKVS
jgi:hypothetical protein